MTEAEILWSQSFSILTEDSKFNLISAAADVGSRLFLAPSWRQILNLDLLSGLSEE